MLSLIGVCMQNEGDSHGRKYQPPEQADSWGEFRARLELERAASVSPWSGPERTVATLLFFVGLIASGYALTEHHWWLWLVMLTPLAIAGVLAARAVDRADHIRERAAELNQFENAWLDHLHRHSPTR